MVSLPEKATAGNPGSNRAMARLQPLEVEVIQLFVQLSRILGQPRSLGEIYGLLFISAQPLAMDDLMARLKLSKGSASQGLKFLRNLGAVQMVYVPGERRVHYEAVAELRNLVSSFLREKIEPHLGEGKQRLERLRALADALPAEERERVGRRIALLQSWGERSRQFVPVIVKLLGG
jgi:DNA-binding transcriptional regulator GbsR (MarR family)